MRRFHLISCLLVVALTSVSVRAEAPSAARILEQARQKLAAIRDYSVDVRLDVKSEALTVKGMTMILCYKKPGKMRIVAREGLAIMPRTVVIGDVIGELTKNCRPTLVGTEKKNGADCYKIRLDPAQQSGAPPVFIWLDRSRLVVRATRLNGPFPVKTDWSYGRVDEKYDMPRRVVAESVHPAGQTRGRRDPDAPRIEGGWQSFRATLTFSNYRVNKGIRDSFFEEEDRK